MKQLLLLCFLALSINANSQSIIYVDSSVSSSGSGTSWATAYKTLNEALNVVNAGSAATKYVINVARGTYYTTGVQAGTNRDSAFFFIRGGVQLYGGYPGGGGARAVAANPTILSGNIGALGSSTDNSYHVMVVAGIGATADTVIVDGISCVGGYASGTGTKNYNALAVSRFRGGGMYTTGVAQGKLIINNCTFTADTSVGGDGGGMYNTSSMPIVSNCTFLGNAAPGQGGGAIGNASTSTPMVSNTIFQGNSAAFGAAMHVNRNTSNTVAPYLSNCTFSGNVATNDGGAMYASSAGCPPYTISNCSFTGNTAANGGAIYINDINYATTASTLLNCSFTNNTAGINGGAIYNTGSLSAYLIDSCTFAGNKAGSAGGGLYNPFVASSTSGIVSHCTFTADSASLGGGVYNSNNNSTYNNCSFSSNKAAYGAGMYSFSSTTGIIRNSVFSGNMALIAGGGLMNHGLGSTYKETNNLFSGNTAGVSGGAVYDSAASPAITNCTFAGDSAVAGNGIYNTTSSSPAMLNCIVWEGTGNSIYNTSGSTPVITYSTVQGGYSGTGNSGSNPLFVGAVSSSAAPTTSGNYHLLPCSPAVNGGNNSGSYTGVLDVEGNARLFGSSVDQGAYEYQSVYPVPISGNNSVCVNGYLQLSNVVTGGTWVSSNPALAAVSAAGLVTGIAAGTDTITYSVTSSTCPNTVTKIVTVNPLPVIAAIGGGSSVCINSTTTLSNATTGGTWSSSNSAIATVSSNGVVSGLALGVDTITYTVINSNGCTNRVSKIITVSPYPAVTAISGSSTVCANDTTTLRDTTTGGSWMSINTGIVTVSTNGMITGVAAGTTNIIYTVTNSAGCASQAVKAVTVNAAPVVGTITGNSGVCITGTLQLSDTTSGGAWSSSNTGVATISAAGLVSPASTGSTTITYTVTNSNGCKGAASKVITVAPIYNHTATASMCNGSAYLFGGQSINTAGTYTHLFQSIYGCDSNVSLTLSVDTVDITVNQTGTILSANQTSATYQWIDCDDGNRDILGETMQTFTAIHDGHYAVVIAYNTCSDTSECYTVTGVGVGITFPPDRQVTIAPNPSKGWFTVASLLQRPTAIVVKDFSGRQLLSVQPQGTSTRIDMSAYAPGFYLIDVWYGSDRISKNISILR